MHKYHIHIYLGIMIFTYFIAISCNLTTKKVKSPAGYNLSSPEKFTMPGSLLEISGISFGNGKSDTIYAIQDEQGKLFKLAWGNKKPFHTRFADNGDYEDVAIMNDKIFVLKSNGSLISFLQKASFNETADSVTEYKKLLPEGEYEGMYADAASNKLFVLCKKCQAYKGGHAMAVYMLDEQGATFSITPISVDMAENNQLKKVPKAGFRPSALAKNPLTGEWFIISGANKFLLIADGNFKVKEAYPLSTNTFNQPEGIAFDEAANLYISNEGDELSEGNILKFVRSVK